jgi:hypothetical protein
MARERESPRPLPPGTRVIDCDLHNTVPSIEVLLPYLAPHWQEYISKSQFRGPTDTAYPPSAATSVRPGAAAGDGSPPGATVASLTRPTLDHWGTEIGILTCDYAVASIRNPDTAAAVAAAVNDWQIEEWLERDRRLRASIVVPNSPVDAAREAERVGAHPGFVQVGLPVRSPVPYGNRIYYPLLEAAVKHDLVVALHFGGAPGNPPTASGWPTYYLEEYVAMASAFQSQLLSLVAEGAFDRFPELRVAVVEGGFAWVPGFLWRFDKAWRGLHREVPWMKRPPSAYIGAHVRFTLQPIDGPSEPGELLRIIERLPNDELIMFSTDYPHWQYETDADAIPSGLSSDFRRKILFENARSFYRFEDGADG